MAYRHGREPVSALTPVGRLAVEIFMEDNLRQRPVAIGKSRYDLSDWPFPGDVVVGELPRISASGG